MSTSKNYLSIGADVATLTEVSFNTQHNAGLSGYLRADQAYLGQLKVLTPRNFISNIEMAKLNEQLFFPSVVELSKEFLVSHEQHIQEISKRIELLNEEDQNSLTLTNETNSNKPK